MPVLSYDDLYARFLALPDHQIGEIIAGELVVSPRPTMPHAGSTSDILTQLRFRFGRKPGGGDNPGGWHLVVEPEIHLMDEILVPDIAGWKRETLPLLPRAAFMSVPPDWVCEVLPDGTTRHDRRVKTRIYHRWGVRWLWLVDPRENVIEAYRREGPFWVRLGDWADDERARIEPFEAVELELEHVWEGFGE